MGGVKLELSIALDPNPDWTFEDLISELNALEIKIEENSCDISNWKSNVFEDHHDMDNVDGEDEEGHDQRSTVARRFNFDELYLNVDCDDPGDLMEKVDPVESRLLELLGTKVKEDIRNQISALETELKNETDKSVSALVRVERYRKERSKMDGKLDTQYQRRIAKALDHHLTLVQRDLEVTSQIQERKIRIAAAAHQERAEAAKRAALEAQRRAAANEAAARKASETSKKPDTDANKIRAAESALNLEKGRLEKLKQLDEQVEALKSRHNENNFAKYQRQIAKSIQQITGTEESVKQKEYELLKTFCDAHCPQSISIAALAKKVVDNCKRPGNPAFAQAFVIVRITSMAPHAMDLILAELNKACIYTVPKHYSRSAFGSNEAYYKALGFQQDDEGKIESIDSYLTRLESYMKLYGALVQTDNNNVHGLKEGWGWLARFVNALPANRYTAGALSAFLRMAGYALFTKYRNQFLKLLNMVSDNFLNTLKEQGDSQLNPVIVEIESYIKDREFLREPEGRQFKTNLLSDHFVA